jgi:septin family protein
MLHKTNRFFKEITFTIFLVYPKTTGRTSNINSVLKTKIAGISFLIETVVRRLL